MLELKDRSGFNYNSSHLLAKMSEFFSLADIPDVQITTITPSKRGEIKHFPLRVNGRKIVLPCRRQNRHPISQLNKKEVITHIPRIFLGFFELNWRFCECYFPLNGDSILIFR